MTCQYCHFVTQMLYYVQLLTIKYLPLLNEIT